MKAYCLPCAPSPPFRQSSTPCHRLMCSFLPPVLAFTPCHMVLTSIGFDSSKTICKLSFLWKKVILVLVNSNVIYPCLRSYWCP
ncbi:hypothetical protein PAHAL_1G078900 [Panicum hallii]|uniref:Uncharacterized protein n=1 Tax=Panicum hallii TaxID=206008 RepID=A0A2T8KUH8_9POAL|nr:hypothetical protein PAHAL_1G078900 [Panicum hallii]